jgi:hypothetical protein
MTALRAGELVTVAGERSERDGIVFDIPSSSKVVVAVPDAKRGAVLRTVHPRMVTERGEAGEHDEALRRLIRRTPAAAGPGGPRGAGGAGRGRPGHSRPTAHRTTGK